MFQHIQMYEAVVFWTEQHGYNWRGHSAGFTARLEACLVHGCLLQVVGFDMVDDESKPERRPTKHSPLPQVIQFEHMPT